LPTRPSDELIAQEIKIVAYNEEATDENPHSTRGRTWDIAFNLSETPDSRWVLPHFMGNGGALPEPCRQHWPNARLRLIGSNPVS